jgi:hypothetical protein
MIDVGREVRIGIRVVERLAEEYLVDGLRGGLDVPRANKVLAERLANEVPEGHPPGSGGRRGTPVEIGWEQELGPVHV